MALVWGNCRKFNAEGSDIVAAADSSEAAFLHRWQAAGERDLAHAAQPMQLCVRHMQHNHWEFVEVPDLSAPAVQAEKLRRQLGSHLRAQQRCST